MAKPGRPKNQHEPVKVTITATPKLALYLDDLVAEEGYGNSRAEVARNLVWSAIRELLSKHLLDRRKSTGRRSRARQGAGG